MVDFGVFWGIITYTRQTHNTYNKTQGVFVYNNGTFGKQPKCFNEIKYLYLQESHRQCRQGFHLQVCWVFYLQVCRVLW